MGDPNWNFVLSGVIELPSYTLGPFVLNRIGRKKTVIASHLITAAGLLPLCFLTSGESKVSQKSLDITPQALFLVPWLLAKFGTAWSFITLFVFTSEIFPLSSRGFCVGASATLANIGALLAPLVIQFVGERKEKKLQSKELGYASFHFALFALVSAGTVALTFFLPETHA